MIRWLLVALIGSLMLAVPRAGAAEAQLNFWAMEAHTEGRAKVHFDPGLEAVKEAVKTLKHDTYTKLKIGTHTFKGSKDFSEKLNTSYQLKASVPEEAEGGRYRMKLRITLSTGEKDGKEIEALETDLLLQPGKKVLVRGLKLADDRDLVVVLSLSADTDDKED